MQQDREALTCNDEEVNAAQISELQWHYLVQQKIMTDNATHKTLLGSSKTAHIYDKIGRHYDTISSETQI